MTTVQESAAVRHGIWVLCPALGAAVLWGLVAISGWVAGLAWFPIQGPFELVASWPWAPAAAPFVGVLAGLVLAALWAASMLTVTVSADSVSLRRSSGSSAVFARTDIGTVFVDGKDLVLLGPSGAELAREKNDLRASALESAFAGYPWSPVDPHASSYRLWVDHSPDLPADVNALLAARRKAVRADSEGEAAVLTAELRKYGVFVRDVKKHQYWRK